MMGVATFIFKFITSIKNYVRSSDIPINKNAGCSIENEVVAATAKQDK